MTKIGYWLTDESVPTAEILAGLGYDFVVLDIEHGPFDLAVLDRFIPLLSRLGLEVFAKVRQPDQASIQQALDLGADGIIVPHVRDFAHAAELAAYAKYPPRGIRSVAGGRAFSWGPWTSERASQIDAETLFLPLIEEPGAVEDIERIAQIPNVDGFQMGPGDLSMLSGRGTFTQKTADWVDADRCVAAMVAAGKIWMYPAWTESEQRWAIANHAPYLIVGTQYGAVAHRAASIKASIAGLLT